MKLKQMFRKLTIGDQVSDAIEAAEFSKVSFEQYEKDFRTYCNANMPTDIIRKIYDNIKLPSRATSKSAGYDFYAPFGFSLPYAENIIIPTGIRCECRPDYFLSLVPRSGIGFKNRAGLANTVGIIDADYFEATNEGHILIKMVNGGLRRPHTVKNIDSETLSATLHTSKKGNNNSSFLTIVCGKGFVQGIFIPYGVVKDDNFYNGRTRKGGFGSTDDEIKNSII